MPEEALAPTRPRLGQVLVDLGHLTQGALDRALERQRSPEAKGVPIGLLLLSEGAITPAQLSEALGKQGIELRACPRCRALHNVPAGGPADPSCPACHVPLLPVGEQEFTLRALDAISPRAAGAGDAMHLRQVGRYQLAGRLGQGGMGSVYLAFDTGLHRWAALKTLRAPAQATAEERVRIRREAEIAARLSHPGIVPVHDMGWADDGKGGEMFYFTMDYVRGRTLREVLRGGPRLPLAEALRVARALADALGYAHSQGVLHRDVKPENVILAEGSGQVVLTDFGLAKELGRGATLTVSGEVFGTPEYMSPEQVQGRLSRIGPASDVYALGVTAYEMLCGRTPHSGTQPADVMARILRDDPQPVRRLETSIPPDLESVVMKCLSREPSARYPSAKELAEDLDRFSRGEAVRAARVTTWYLVRRWASRRRRGIAVWGALLVLLATSGWAVWRLWWEAKKDWREVGSLPRFEDWVFLNGHLNDKWTVHDGNLCHEGVGPMWEGEVLCPVRCAGNVRLEYRACFDPDSQDIGDLSAVLCARPNGATAGYRGGYYLGFGGYMGTTNLVRRAGSEVTANTSFLPERGVWYQVQAQRLDGVIRLTAARQGEAPRTVLEWTDLFPIEAPQQEYVGFYQYAGHARFTDVHVFVQPPAERTARSDLGDVFFGARDWGRAADTYQQCAEADAASREVFLLKEGLAKVEMSRDSSYATPDRDKASKDAAEILQRVASAGGGTPLLRTRAAVGLARLYDAQGEAQRAIRVLEDAAKGLQASEAQTAVFALRELGESRRMGGQIEAAAAYLSSHVALQGIPEVDLCHACMVLWDCLGALGRYDALLESLEQGPVRSPEWHNGSWERTCWEFRALALAAKGKWREVETEELARYPRNVSAAEQGRDLALVRLEAADAAGAISALREAEGLIDLSNGDGRIYAFSYGLDYFCAGADADAERWWKRVAEGSDYSATVARYLLGVDDEATWRRSFPPSLDPDTPENRLLQAIARLRGHDTRGAKEILSGLAEIGFDSAPLRKALLARAR